MITAFLLGFAFAQLIYGPLSDRFGRRPVLVVALVYVLTSAVAAISGSFELLLVARAAMGASAAGARVVTVALVRDCFAGRAMARVMSLAFIVFMAAPIFAPTFGQGVLTAGGSWRMIFWGVGEVSALVVAWFWLRMPETLDPENAPVAAAERGSSPIMAGAARSLRGGLHARRGAAVGRAVRLHRFGPADHAGRVRPARAAHRGVRDGGQHDGGRLVPQFADRDEDRHAADLAHCALGADPVRVHSPCHRLFGASRPWWTFAILQALMMASFGLATSNFSAMAMERMGEIAGTASSLQGFVSTLGGALIGAQIGQSFDGTTVPLYAGFLTMGVLAFVAIAIAEEDGFSARVELFEAPPRNG